jgi:hypothetical protein
LYVYNTASGASVLAACVQAIEAGRTARSAAAMRRRCSIAAVYEDAHDAAATIDA